MQEQSPGFSGVAGGGGGSEMPGVGEWGGGGLDTPGVGGGRGGAHASHEYRLPVDWLSTKSVQVEGSFT